MCLGFGFLVFLSERFLYGIFYKGDFFGILMGALGRSTSSPRSGRSMKGERSGMTTPNRLWGVTNGGCCSRGGLLDSPSSVSVL